MDWLFVIQLQIITHQLSFYPNSNALLLVERFKIICLLCHLGGMAVMFMAKSYSVKCHHHMLGIFLNLKWCLLNFIL